MILCSLYQSIDDIVFLVSIDDIVFIVYKNDLGASAVSHLAETWCRHEKLKKKTNTENNNITKARERSDRAGGEGVGGGCPPPTVGRFFNFGVQNHAIWCILWWDF